MMSLLVACSVVPPFSGMPLQKEEMERDPAVYPFSVSPLFFRARPDVTPLCVPPLFSLQACTPRC